MKMIELSNNFLKQNGILTAEHEGNTRYHIIFEYSSDEGKIKTLKNLFPLLKKRGFVVCERWDLGFEYRDEKKWEKEEWFFYTSKEELEEKERRDNTEIEKINTINNQSKDDGIDT